MLLPEHTVDALFAVELQRAIPEVLLWSPTQFAGSIDHLISPSFRWMAFEAKGITNERRIRIDSAQLRTHAANRMRIDYVLPAFEQTMGNLGSNTCSVCCANNVSCPHCVRDDRSRAVIRVPGAPRHLPPAAAPATLDQRTIAHAQYHFGHWLWIISANDLLNSAPASQISADDADLAAIHGAKRLCHSMILTAAKGVRVRDAESFSWNQISTEDPEGQQLKSEDFQKEIRTAIVATYESDS